MSPAIERALRDQGQVVQMLRLRDELGAAVECSEVRWSPVTRAAERVLYVLQRVAVQQRGEE